MKKRLCKLLCGKNKFVKQDIIIERKIPKRPTYPIEIFSYLKLLKLVNFFEKINPYPIIDIVSTA